MSGDDRTTHDPAFSAHQIHSSSRNSFNPRATAATGAVTGTATTVALGPGGLLGFSGLVD